MSDDLPSADELMESHLAAKTALSAVPAAAWLDRAQKVLDRPAFKTAFAELEAISEVLPEGTQAAVVMRQFVQTGRTLPLVIAAMSKA